MSETSSPAVRWANTPERAVTEAALHLERMGYQVLERSYREADRIAAADDRLIVCGVRALRPLAPADASGGGLQRRRLWRAATAWLCERGAAPWRSVRFDLISVYLDRMGEPVSLEHTPDAF